MVSIAIIHIFIMIGTNANAANFLTELSIPPNSAVMDTNITYGIVILQSVTVKSNFSPLAKKPGAIITIKYGIAICKSRVRTINVNNSRINILPPNLLASLFELTSFSLNIGINTAESAPSAKILRKRLGNLKATFTQSAMDVVPNVAAMNSSRARPKNLESRVKNATIIPDRNNIF